MVNLFLMREISKIMITHQLFKGGTGKHINEESKWHDIYQGIIDRNKCNYIINSWTIILIRIIKLLQNSMVNYKKVKWQQQQLFRGNNLVRKYRA